jgi:hypothetical protein
MSNGRNAESAEHAEHSERLLSISGPSHRARLKMGTPSGRSGVVFGVFGVFGVPAVGQRSLDER